MSPSRSKDQLPFSHVAVLGAGAWGTALALASLRAGRQTTLWVREDDVLDAKLMVGGERDVLFDVALGIDDARRAGLLVADDVRRVRQAIQIKLMKDHALHLPLIAKYTRADSAARLHPG